jgi:predicted transcriptional regulator
MSYRDRSRLHKNKLNDFISWCIFIKGYINMDTKGKYEAFRILRSGELIIGHKRDNTDHITVTDKGLKLVNEWLNNKSH